MGCLLAIGWDKLGYRKISTKNGDELFVGGGLAIFIAWFISYFSGFAPYYVETSIFSELLVEAITFFLNIGIVCVMIALVTESTRYGSFIKWKWLTSIGLISYSLYIWQQFFFFAPDLPHWMCYLPSRVGLAFGIAVCAYYFVERPLNKFRRQIKLKN
jgi:peptidoglycan/LPS O-acetylase OafA/YrhL